MSTGNLDRASRASLYAVLVGAPLAFGAREGWTQTAAFLLIGAAVAAWLAGALRAGMLEWRRTPLDLPVALLLALVLRQLVALARGLERIGQPRDACREYRELVDLQPDQPDADRAVARLEGRRR